MKTVQNYLTKIRELFIPEGSVDKAEVREVLPFFALITLALVWLYVVNIRLIESPLAIAIFTVLMVLHLGMYWAAFRFVRNNRSLRWYFIFQGLLAFLITFLADDFGLAVGLYAALIGNAVGMLKSNRDMYIFIPGFLLLAGLAIALQSGMEQIVQWSYVALPSVLLSGFIAFMFRRQLEMREKAEQLLSDLQEAHTRLEAYAEQVEELTLTHERQRIARELHDTLAQELTGVVLQLEAVSTHIEKDNPDRADEILQGAMQQSRVTLAEARKVIDDLRSDHLPAQSLEEAVREEAARFETLAGIPCQISVDLDQDVTGATRQHLLKIISEGLNNVAKHASAQQTWLQLAETEKGFQLEIKDDGQGFNLIKESENSGQYGLIGIQERVELLHGKLEIDSHPGKGTRLGVHIPIKTSGEVHGR